MPDLPASHSSAQPPIRPRSDGTLTRFRRFIAAVGALVIALPLALATGSAPATAATGGGSILFVKNSNVWIADGDGRNARAVTTTGTSSNPWYSPTQSNAGIVVAGRGPLVYRMDQSGNVLNTLDLPALEDSAGNLLDGAPAKLAISHDGTLIAYTYHFYSCSWGCYVRAVTAFTSSTKVSPPGAYGVTHYDNPEWVSPSRVIVDGWLTQIIRFYDLARGDFFWFDEDSYTPDDKILNDPALSPDGKHAAAVRGEFDESSIIWYDVTGNPKAGARPPIPTPVCVTNTAQGFANPTFSADSKALAWEEPDGIWVVDQLNPGDCTTIKARLVISGGSQPSWSAATIKPYKPVKAGTGAKKITSKKAPKIKGTAKVGRKLTAGKGTWGVKPTSVTYRWYRGSKPIKGATKAAYRLTKKDRGKKIRVKVTAKRAGYASKSRFSKAVKVRK
ncbi:hypothetical protein GCM10010401_12500 [Rarobacter faecitabidus]|uniref:WD40 repeat protein n=1 Tax=Rarobacter faecitabidus TaxID=13243 RepID=A0A542ZNT4_RARFA|nr:hypothetical protein [Rarobacter faecitabidus]TQL62013.1 hypothetical protein FB461_1645 [Rarobacter faecitabidus]